MHVTPNTLRELAKKFLTVEEQVGVEFYLENREIELVSRYILEAVDRLWRERILDDEEAVRAIQELDLGPKDKATLSIEFECLRELF